MKSEARQPQSAAPGRNDPCPCGSGRKYKKCCLAADEARAREARAATPASPAAPTPPPAADQETKWKVPDPSTDPLAENLPEPDDEPPMSPAVEAAWDAFDAIPNPTTAQMDAHLERLLALPTDETSWNDLFRLFSDEGHEDLLAVFRRIDRGVKPTKASALGYFYWVAVELFVRRGRHDLVPEVLAGLQRLDGETYEADALRYSELWALAAGCEAETLALVEHFLPVLRADAELMAYAPSEAAEMVFHLRLGQAIRSGVAAATDVAVLTEALLRGLAPDIEPAYAELAAAAVQHRDSLPQPTRQDFIFPVGRESDDAELRRRFLALLAVARFCWEDGGRPPGVSLHGLWAMADAAHGERREWPPRRRKEPVDLIACLEPSGIDRRIAIAAADLLGSNRPFANLLIEAHADLLRFAVRFNFVTQKQAEKCERELASLRKVVPLRS